MTETTEEKLDTCYKLMGAVGFIMFIAGLAVGKFFMGYW